MICVRLISPHNKWDCEEIYNTTCMSRLVCLSQGKRAATRHRESRTAALERFRREWSLCRGASLFSASRQRVRGCLSLTSHIFKPFHPPLLLHRCPPGPLSSANNGRSVTGTCAFWMSQPAKVPLGNRSPLFHSAVVHLHNLKTHDSDLTDPPTDHLHLPTTGRCHLALDKYPPCIHICIQS